ncbi:MAG: hypothetical protein ACREE9_22435 [Stellaceae bacterium]
MREAAERQRTAAGHAVPQLVDAEGNIGNPYVVIDPLRRLLAAGKITLDGLAAADEFRRDFRFAYGSRIVAADLSRPVVSGKRPAEISDASIGARRRVERKIAHLGGSASAAASCAWHCIGLDMPLADWLRVRRWNADMRLSPAEAEAVLIAAIATIEQPQRRRVRDERPVIRAAAE